jgi:hypothetical protein
VIRTGASGSGVRFGVTWHKFLLVGGDVWLAELGVVLPKLADTRERPDRRDRGEVGPEGKPHRND